MSAACDRAAMEAVIRRYYAGCNAGDEACMQACFTPEAVHYFPPGMYEGPFRGAATIAARWRQAVEAGGSAWTIDALLFDEARGEAVIEWSHWKARAGTVLRGAEWVVFDRPSGRIAEIRAYYASPQAAGLSRLELGGFDYPGRGYPLHPARDPA